MRTMVLMLAMALAGCSDSQSVDDAVRNSGQAGDPRAPAAAPSAPLDPGVVPVRVGEGGVGFPACQSIGLVVGATTLPVRRAPFSEGAEADRLAGGTRVAICTRSHDQRWLGVVYPAPAPSGASAPADASGMPQAVSPAAACEVATPVERRQGYDGPCRSGWVASAFVRLVGA